MRRPVTASGSVPQQQHPLPVEAPAGFNADLLLIALAGAVGATLAAIDLASRSLWLDEGSTFAISSQHGSALWHAIAHDGGNMLIYYLLTHLLIGWFGDASWVLRLPSVLATAATGGLTVAIALRLFPSNRRLALAAGLLAVVSLPLVFWGQDARGYAWLVTLDAASFLALLAILQTPSGRPVGRGQVIAYVLTTAAALYVGFDAALLIPAQLILLTVYRGHGRLVITSLVGALLLCVPLVVLALERGTGQLFWVPPLSPSVAGKAVVILLSAAMPPNFHATSTTVVTVLVSALISLAAVALGVRAALARTERLGSPAPSSSVPSRSVRFVLCWLLVPSGLALLAYAVGEPVELARVVILALPPLALLTAWLLLGAGVQPRAGVPPRVGVAAVTLLLALRLLQIVPSYGLSPEPWRGVTAQVLRATPADTRACIAFYPQDGREPFDYYLRSLKADAHVSNLVPVLPALPWSQVRPYVEEYSGLTSSAGSRIATRCPRLWLISSHAGQRNGTRASAANYRRYQHLQEVLSGHYPHSSTSTFGWASKIEVTLFER